MDVILNLLPKSVASVLRAQPPELLMLVAGLIMTLIVISFYYSMRRW